MRNDDKLIQALRAGATKFTDKELARLLELRREAQVANDTTLESQINVVIARDEQIQEGTEGREDGTSGGYAGPGFGESKE